jgi:hypothetical protein
MFVMVLIPDLFHNIGSIILCHEEYLRLIGRRGLQVQSSEQWLVRGDV